MKGRQDEKADRRKGRQAESLSLQGPGIAASGEWPCADDLPRHRFARDLWRDNLSGCPLWFRTKGRQDEKADKLRACRSRDQGFAAGYCRCANRSATSSIRTRFSGGTTSQVVLCDLRQKGRQDEKADKTKRPTRRKGRQAESLSLQGPWIASGEWPPHASAFRPRTSSFVRMRVAACRPASSTGAIAVTPSFRGRRPMQPVPTTKSGRVHRSAPRRATRAISRTNRSGQNAVHA
jgi:hypothetical protein